MAAWQGLLEELVRDRRSALIGYAALLTGDRGEAEDLVHDAVVRTFGRPRSFPSLNADVAATPASGSRPPVRAEP